MKTDASASAPQPADADQLLLAQVAIDSVSDLIFWSDGAGRFIYANHAACSALEYDRPELLQLSVADVAPDFPGAAWMAHWQALKRCGSMTLETELRSRTGRRILVEVSTRYVTHAGHEYTSASVRDITERARAQREVLETRAQFETIFRESPMAIAITRHTDGAILEANPAFERFYGFARDELIGRTTLELALYGAEGRRQLMDAMAANHLVRNLELRARAKDGRTFVTSSCVAPISFQGQACLLCMVADVTDERTRERELRDREEKFGTAFRRAPLVMTISLPQDGRLIEVNDKFCEVTGYSREEALGRTSVELGLLLPGDRAGIKKELESQAHLPDRELVATIKGGRQLEILWGAEIIHVGGEERLLTIVQDISETVRLQAELAKTQKLESLGLLAGGLAHDFNNVLTGVLGNLSFARRLIGENHQAAQCLLECEKAAVRASDLTRQLLTFSRGGAPTRKVVDTRRLIDEAVSFALRGSNVKAIIDLPADLWSLHADEGQIAQVLANLLINAKQAMPAGGTVTIRAVNDVIEDQGSAQLTPGSYVRMDVADTGAGMDQELQGKIFDPYFTTKPGGTGLGLSSVYSIVKRHAGGVQVASERGVGTTFSLHLPAAARASAAPPADVVEITLLPAGQGKVLVMDDEELIRDLASRVLESLGYEAVACADGETAVALFRAAREQAAPFRAALLDLTIPGGMGGKDAAAQMRQIDIEAILIVSTGYSNDPVVADYRAYGFAGAVAKPYAIDTLADELTRLLRGAP